MRFVHLREQRTAEEMERLVELLRRLPGTSEVLDKAPRVTARPASSVPSGCSPPTRTLRRSSASSTRRRCERPRPVELRPGGLWLGFGCGTELALLSADSRRNAPALCAAISGQRSWRRSSTSQESSSITPNRRPMWPRQRPAVSRTPWSACSATWRHIDSSSRRSSPAGAWPTGAQAPLRPLAADHVEPSPGALGSADVEVCAHPS